MSKKSLVDEFDVKLSSPINYEVTDYEIFKNKELLDALRNKIIQNLIDNKIPENLNDYVNKVIDEVLKGENLSELERSHLFRLIDNEINKYGPISELLDNPEITEIMVNSPSEIYIEVNGKIIKEESISFINESHIIRTIQKMIQPIGRTIDASNPMVDARLVDGSRLNAIIYPLSVKGPILTIRKFKKDIDNIDKLISNGTLTTYMARFLEACVLGKLNIIISGGTGSGKTTVLNVLSSFIKDNERIITIEDAAELNLKQKHVVSLETRLSNYEKKNEITIRDLVINSLRMRPDRIIVGEVRGKEAFDMLQAMNTGHSGSITTMHANSCIDALNRVETMVLMSNIEIPIKAIRSYISNAIDIVIHTERLSDGRRKITSISEVLDVVNDEIKIKEIFGFKKKGKLANDDVNGEFVLYKYTPEVYKKLKENGIDNLEDIFSF